MLRRGAGVLVPVFPSQPLFWSQGLTLPCMLRSPSTLNRYPTDDNTVVNYSQEKIGGMSKLFRNVPLIWIRVSGSRECWSGARCRVLCGAVGPSGGAPYCARGGRTLQHSPPATLDALLVATLVRMVVVRLGLRPHVRHVDLRGLLLLVTALRSGEFLEPHGFATIVNFHPSLFAFIHQRFAFRGA
jgi:hypothetical protein